MGIIWLIFLFLLLFKTTLKINIWNTVRKPIEGSILISQIYDTLFFYKEGVIMSYIWMNIEASIGVHMVQVALTLHYFYFLWKAV